MENKVWDYSVHLKWKNLKPKYLFHWHMCLKLFLSAFIFSFVSDSSKRRCHRQWMRPHAAGLQAITLIALMKGKTWYVFRWIFMWELPITHSSFSAHSVLHFFRGGGWGELQQISWERQCTDLKENGFTGILLSQTGTSWIQVGNARKWYEKKVWTCSVSIF